jgi:hypothetical protein
VEGAAAAKIKITSIIKRNNNLNSLLYMGMSESGFKIMVEPINNCVKDVLGSFDCTIKSKCCESYKMFDCYAHCRTNEDERMDSQDEELK